MPLWQQLLAIFVVISLCVSMYAVGYQFGRMDTLLSDHPKHYCPHCKSRLRPVTVVGLTYRAPEDAAWVCNGSWWKGHSIAYFADIARGLEPVDLGKSSVQELDDLVGDFGSL